MQEVMCSSERSDVVTLVRRRSTRSLLIHSVLFTPSALQVWERTFDE